MGSRSLLLVEAAELFAGEDVEVDVVDSLAGEFADVGDDAVAVRKSLLLRELRNDAVDVADDGLIFRRHLRGGGRPRHQHRRRDLISQKGAPRAHDHIPL